MGTRGCWGFRLDGQDKLTYNHFDSYPTGLGDNLITVLRGINLEELKQQVKSLRLVDSHSKPTTQEREQLKQFANLTVGSGSDEDWYCLLRETQGNLQTTLQCGYMIDSHDFLKSSLFCEWAYVINLDENTLEVYKGFQTQPHNKGRYGTSIPDDEYYPVALIKTYVLGDIPQDWAEQLEQETNNDY